MCNFTHHFPPPPFYSAILHLPSTEQINSFATTAKPAAQTFKLNRPQCQASNTPSRQSPCFASVQHKNGGLLAAITPLPSFLLYIICFPLLLRNLLQYRKAKNWRVCSEHTRQKKRTHIGRNYIKLQKQRQFNKTYLLNLLLSLLLHSNQNVVDDHECNEDEAQVAVQAVQDVNQGLVGQEHCNDGTQNAKNDGNDLVALGALLCKQANAGPQKGNSSGVDAAEDDDCEDVSEQGAHGASQNQRGDVSASDQIDVRSQCAAAQSGSSEDEYGGQDHANISLELLVGCADLSKECCEPEDNKAAVGSTGSPGAVADLNQIHAAVDLCQTISQLGSTGDGANGGNGEDDDDDNGTDHAQSIQNAVEAEVSGSNNSYTQNDSTNAVGSAPLLCHGGVSTAAHYEVRAVAEECRENVEELADVLAAVDIVDVTAAGDLQTVAVLDEGPVGVQVDNSGNQNNDPELRAVGYVVLHDLLHGCEAGANVECDASAANANNLCDADFGFFHFLSS